jgi:hypothetical protein
MKVYVTLILFLNNVILNKGYLLIKLVCILFAGNLNSMVLNIKYF